MTEVAKPINYEAKYNEMVKKYADLNYNYMEKETKKRECVKKYLQSDKGKLAKSRANKKYYKKRKEQNKISPIINKDNAVSN